MIVPGVEVDAGGLAIPLQPLPAEQVVSGSPSAGFVELTTTVGVWEHTPGTSTDVEADEVFVVLSGSATLAFTDPALSPVELRAGSVVQLTAGMRTVWTVHETLRKVYIAG
ncbi:cupin domain-containing protein [Microbacterium jejuense]|uniref:Cupin domain-containing protein n=1 Tax=Microbacterium jejuense TaxID=1263637 RepID=A0ABS7HTZ9_9MICO|nr:cupin domain-containing protein [Microbacterium jejuense]MBW9095695.1 cupin domain-containing protein [Microbacterium jejuense]